MSMSIKIAAAFFTIALAAAPALAKDGGGGAGAGVAGGDVSSAGSAMKGDGGGAARMSGGKGVAAPNFSSGASKNTVGQQQSFDVAKPGHHGHHGHTTTVTLHRASATTFSRDTKLIRSAIGERYACITIGSGGGTAAIDASGCRASAHF